MRTYPGGADLSVYHVIRGQHVVHEVMEEAQANDGDQATFVGFDTLFEQMLSFEDQLLSEKFKNEASFESFPKTILGLVMDVKCRQVAQRWQITIHNTLQTKGYKNIVRYNIIFQFNFCSYVINFIVY